MELSVAVEKLFEYKAPISSTTELDKMLLRIFNFPALMASLEDIGTKDNKAELAFEGLPEEMIETVKNLIGPIDIEVLEYPKGGKKFTGFRFDPAQLAELENELVDAEKEKRNH